MLFFLSSLTLIALLVMLVFHYRSVILPHVPERVKSFFPQLNNYAPLTTFSQQAHAGLTSTNFDLEANILDGDSRSGLDENSTREIMDIMSRQRVNFDQARLIRQNNILARNGIDPSGMPLDSKAITRL
ncbi:hypothetical protein C8J56DRAFT_979498 [Mycena floridula]|nr:hypothetical protein C8J56DRAFT_979498 [Mycena floridula]